MRISDWSSDVCSSDLIRKHALVSEGYAARLKAENLIDDGFVAGITHEFTQHLEEEFEAAKSYKPNKADWFAGRWSGLNQPADIETARQNEIGRASCRERVCQYV